MPSSQHFYVVRFEEVVDMKSFPKRTPEGIKAGQALPFCLKTILLTTPFVPDHGIQARVCKYL